MAASEVLLTKIMNQPLHQLQTKINFQFKDEAKLLQALIHRSHLNENKASQLQSNERYEFLGDAVLELWATEKLFLLFPDYSEGVLTNLRSLVVCTENLAKIAKNIDLGDFIQLSRGEETHGGRTNLSILADTFESLIGAIYLDSGFTAVDKFLNLLLTDNITAITKQKVFKDPKSQFQEIAQAKRGVTPHYATISESGPDHQKTFQVGAYIDNDLIATGSGNSKQKAEESAAVLATQKLSS